MYRLCSARRRFPVLWPVRQLTIFSVTVLLLAGNLSPVVAQAPAPACEEFCCETIGDDVYIEWHPGALAADAPLVLFRDRVALVERPAGEFLYVDVGVPTGEHQYTLVYDIPEAEEPVAGSCSAFVETDFGGTTCSVVRHQVSVQWDELPIDIAIEGFIVRRGRQLVAKMPPNEHSFLDAPGAGDHKYTVSAQLAPSPDGSDEEFLVGTCSATVNFPESVPSPEGLQCAILEKAPVCVRLSWRNPSQYDGINVLHGGERIAELEGDVTSFQIDDPGPGQHVFSLIAFVGQEESVPLVCIVDLGGVSDDASLSIENLFDEIGPPPEASPKILPPVPPPVSDRVSVLLSSRFPVRGWSFGLCEAAEKVIVSEFDFDDTIVEELGDAWFVSVDVVEGGLTMNVIAQDFPEAQLPANETWRVVNVRFAGGPEGNPGEVYDVEFCRDLGDPRG